MFYNFSRDSSRLGRSTLKYIFIHVLSAWPKAACRRFQPTMGKERNVSRRRAISYPREICSFRKLALFLNYSTTSRNCRGPTSFCLSPLHFLGTEGSLACVHTYCEDRTNWLNNSNIVNKNIKFGVVRKIFSGPVGKGLHTVW